MTDAARKWLEELRRRQTRLSKLNLMSEGEGHVSRLLEQLDEHDAYYRKVVNDECAPDEVHCTCVPALRDKIDTLQADSDTLVAYIKVIRGDEPDSEEWQALSEELREEIDA